ncbi:pyridoxal phosphate-dependent aminotransferase [Desulfotruncus arcticus]|nr:pyridoxal phosphate-dependent aminotransferase [Desulfotruncus arcticus]
MSISQKITEDLSKPSWLRKLFEEGERLKSIYGEDKVYNFTIGNPGVEPPAAFHEELKRIALNPTPGMHRYMSNAGYLETREAIAQVLQENCGLDFSPNHIVMSCGAGGGLNILLKTILNPGEEVIVLVPYFPLYRAYIDNYGGVIKKVKTNADFQLNLELLAENITAKTKAIIINSPNNPTGVIYPEKSIKELGQLLRAKEEEFNNTIYLISDEPYSKLVFDGLTVPSIFKHVRNSFVVTSHSKDLALPGERIGYVAMHPEIKDADLIFKGLNFCNRALGFVNAPALMQRLVTNLQREEADIEGYLEKRNMLYNHLTSLGFDVVKPAGTFYLFPRSPMPDDIEFIKFALKYNIVVVPGIDFDMPGYFRLSFSVSLDTVMNSLPAFTKLAQDLRLK